MTIHPPPMPDLYLIEESNRKQKYVNEWALTQIPSMDARVEKLEEQLKAVMDSVTDANERLERLLSAIKEEVDPIREHAPKTMRVAAELSFDNMED